MSTHTERSPQPGEVPGDWVRRLLKTPSDRDKQRRIGPSEAGNPCSRCVAEHLAGNKPPQGRYWLGARLGTAIHLALEELTTDVPGVVPETKVTVGELEGYGVIRGSADSLWLDERHLIDFKTTMRDKLTWIKLALQTEPGELEMGKLVSTRHKVAGYIAQTHLYAKGLGNVDKITLVFICRDGSTDSDIWSYTMDYDPEYAEKVWGRLQAIWKALQDGREPDTFASHPECYPCNHTR